MDISDSNKNLTIQQQNDTIIETTTVTNDVPSSVIQSQPIEEMLGSVTTYNNVEGPDSSGNAKNCQQVRSSARVFKKMKLENAQALTTAVDKEKKDVIIDKTEVKKPFRPQWSPEDKDIFFEALNEYGKDFDAIQQHINNRFKKKSLPDTLFKTKDQVRHFYYRTWHKISKHLKFSEDIKKLAQELYALINFGELRKKIGPVTEKTCMKLNELIYRGTVAIRVKGKTIRIKTPMCRALRKLNQLDEKHEDLKLPTRVLVELRPKSIETWLQVQFMSQNPRVRLYLPLQRRLSALLTCLNDRWKSQLTRTHEKVHSYISNTLNENPPCASSSNGIVHNHLLRLTPKTNCFVEVPSINLSEYLTSHRICLNAYEERVGVKVPGERLSMCSSFKGGAKSGTKNRGIKRHRNDSAGEKCVKQKESCDEQDSDNPTTVSDVVDSAINTILSLQKQDSDKTESDSSQKDELKIEQTKSEKTDTNSFTPCKTEEISKIKNGWTLEDCGTLTIGEMYLMFGQDSKLELEYSWDVAEVKNECIENKSQSTTEINDKPEENEIEKSANDVSVTLKKLLSLAKLHYRKERLRCPCGHICGGSKANTASRSKSVSTKTNQRITVEEKNINVNKTAAPENTIRNNNPSLQVNSNCIRNVTVKSEPMFRKPAIYPSNGATTDSFRAQLDSLQKMRPKYTNRKGRPVRNKHVVVERMLPLLPKPLINGHSIVTMKVISQTDDFKNQNKLRPIAPRIEESTTETVEPLEGETSGVEPNKNGAEFEAPPTFFLSANLTGENNGIQTQLTQEEEQGVTNVIPTERVTSPTSISNFLEFDIPTGDTNDLILQHAVANSKDGLTSFAGLLSADDLPDTSTPLSSPSRILKENDHQWLNSEVNDYSLTSLLGHLESPMKTTTPAIIPCDDTPISQDIDSQFPSLLGENGVDFVDQFVDMAAQVDTVNSDIEQLTNT